ncbi:putative sensor protein [Herbihabitans rhizosphaerae]|uniref:Putative sensor protein n=1 Tax=Herbihabitans rhizosphaerae TaxID=1872711 RepID=A0A4Q7L8M9_9PSEU|nr:sensor domain-containing protein [Herbihabitans rhizosphaerae]RZS44762.1 putative sensor protein [Herbihabitans rhizosphaerae]
MNEVETSAWWTILGDGVRYCLAQVARGLAAILLVPVLAATAGLSIVGLGMIFVPAELRLVRWLADGERRAGARWVGNLELAGSHAGKPWQDMLSSRHTGYDLRWVVIAMVVCPTLGFLGLGLLLWPLVNVLLMALWWLVDPDDPIRLLGLFQLDSWGSAVGYGLPVLAVAFVLAALGPPAVAKCAARINQRLLAGSRPTP